VRILVCALFWLVLFASSMSAQSLPGKALVQHAPALNGAVEGSIQIMLPESVTLNGGASVTGDLLLPGMPAVQLNGNPTYGGTLDGTGVATPTSHKVTLNGGAHLGRVVRRTNAVSLPVIVAPPAPGGTRNVSLNNSADLPGDFATLKNLTLNGNDGVIAVPPGTYGEFTANGSNRFVLGVAGGTAVVEYDFQRLTLNGSSRLDVAGPVLVTLAHGPSFNGALGAATHPEWLMLDVADGGVTLNGSVTLHGYVTAPAGTVTINGNAQLIGGVAADRLTVNGNGLLRLIQSPDEPPPFPDQDQDGLDDAWESAHGLNPSLNDAALDNDGDGLSNLQEFQRGLKPNNPDSDNDGLYDGDEITLGRNPLAASPDTQPPSAPASLTVSSVTTNRVTLTWPPATDDLRISGYLVHRDGQPIETTQPIRETTYTDTNLPDGEEFTYQVRSFDFAGNLSPLGVEFFVTTVAADTDQDGLPDEWELKYFGEDPSAPGDDADGDGLTNGQELQVGSNPKDFYNGTKPSLENLHGGGPGPNNELAMMVRRPDGTPWPAAPVIFTVDKGQRRISATAGGPEYSYQVQVRADAGGRAQVYLEPLQP
jgi:hypothetical protein